jgi:hypothetical protein
MAVDIRRVEAGGGEFDALTRCFDTKGVGYQGGNEDQFAARDGHTRFFASLDIFQVECRAAAKDINKLLLDAVKMVASNRPGAQFNESQVMNWGIVIMQLG